MTLNSIPDVTRTLTVDGKTYHYASLKALDSHGSGGIERLPYSLRLLLENLLRHTSDDASAASGVEALLSWKPKSKPRELDFRPARVVLQDFTGVPAVVDLAAMREAMVALGGDPAKINPLQQADLVIDHSVQVDSFGLLRSQEENLRLEFERNLERYTFLKWGQGAFHNLQVVPPNTGIVHQVNLEYLAKLVLDKTVGDQCWLVPDTLVGTDSHTTMINGLGVLGWGVGGIEAEAAMLGEALQMLLPSVVGFRLDGVLPEGATATDLVLRVTEVLRGHGVVGAFVEFIGDGLDALTLPDRATLANMAPEYGATMGFFPADAETLNYLRFTGRSDHEVARAEAYLTAQGLLRTRDSAAPEYDEVLTLDLATVVPSIAGPKRPQDRIALTDAKTAWRKYHAGHRFPKPSPEQETELKAYASGGDPSPSVSALRREVAVDLGERGKDVLRDGDVVIAAITSCTNTSNPSVMLAAGLVAKKALEKGLSVRPAVKTSLAPGSQVVTDYLKRADLLTSLEGLGFFLVGYGCTTCIGNSGPVHDAIAEAAKSDNLALASVLSGNRNFEGRINPVTRVNYLASPPLVVAYALAGRMDIDFANEPIGKDANGAEVWLRDIWPSTAEIRDTLRDAVRSEFFTERYSQVSKGPAEWADIKTTGGATFAWDERSTYIRKPPYFEGMSRDPEPLPSAIEGARVLARLGDSITTDHISPAGSIAKDSPAARYLEAQGVSVRDYNSYGSRRGNHEVMLRGTFANIRLRNMLTPEKEGGYAVHFPSGDTLSIYDAAMRYADEGTPLVIIAGKEYGTGSSRDWAAKGTQLLGIKAVIAESYERIHRSNLLGMGVLPLQFLKGESATSLKLTGHETFSIHGLDDLKPGARLKVKADDISFEVVARIDAAAELEYLRHGGILTYVLRKLAA